MDAWTNQLQAGASPEQIALGIVQSGEYHTKLVNQDYTALLARPADAAGSAEFTAWLNHGGSAAFVQSQMLGSSEFWQHAGGSNPAFLHELYQDVLGRGVDPSGAATF